MWLPLLRWHFQAQSQREVTRMRTAWRRAATILVEADIKMLKEAGLVVVRAQDWERIKRYRSRKTPIGNVSAIRQKSHLPLALLVSIVDDVVATKMGIAVNDIYTKRRYRVLVDARSLCCLVLYRLAEASWPDLAVVYGLGHDTLMRGARMYDAYLDRVHLPTRMEVEKLVLARIKKLPAPPSPV